MGKKQIKTHKTDLIRHPAYQNPFMIEKYWTNNPDRNQIRQYKVGNNRFLLKIIY